MLRRNEIIQIKREFLIVNAELKNFFLWENYKKQFDRKNAF